MSNLNTLGLKRILFPFDFSDMSVSTAPFVHVLACQAGASVTLLSVLPPVWDFGFTGPPAQTAELEALRTKLSVALVKELAGLTVERVAQRGDPASIIADYAHSQAIDLIMMPTHGLGPYRGLLLGSVTAKVLHDARCPVWTAPHVEDPFLAEHQACRQVLCAVDGTAKTVPLLKWASEFAASMSSLLHVVHAVPSISDWPSLARERALQEEVRKEASTTVQGLQRDAGVEAPLRVAVGDPAQVVRDDALRTQADIVIVGRGVLGEALGRLRTHAHSIIRRAPCPVISV